MPLTEVDLGPLGGRSRDPTFYRREPRDPGFKAPCLPAIPSTWSASWKLNSHGRPRSSSFLCASNRLRKLTEEPVPH